MIQMKTPIYDFVMNGTVLVKCDKSIYGTVIIPNGVTEIGWAFDGRENIQATYKGKTYTYDQIEDLYSTINSN